MDKIRPFTKALSLLKEAKLRPTQQRLALARLLLEGEHRHVTAEQLHGDALMAKIRVSLATVYNTLHQFTNAGLLREVVVEQGRSYFDTNTSDHHHFFNVDRGELIDIPGDALTVGSLPPAPRGTNVSRVDIIVQVREANTRS
jgi:Fur family transcriptional regulator, iron response regulator